MSNHILLASRTVPTSDTVGSVRYVYMWTSTRSHISADVNILDTWVFDALWPILCHRSTALSGQRSFNVL